MRLLLDTHTFLWFISDDPLLSPSARSLMQEGDNELLLSMASVWEIAIKVSIGKLPLGQPIEALLPAQLQQNDVKLLPIELQHTLRVASLPFHHRDPFDRLLIAQAFGGADPYPGSGPRHRWLRGSTNLVGAS